MEIFYGIENKYVNVTAICLSKLNCDNIITIPAGDHARAIHFIDHLVDIPKNITILHNHQLITYDASYTIKINLLNNTITANLSNEGINKKLRTLQSKLNLKYGTFMDELPEQKMAVRYLTGKEKVLELGANIGRNSLIIASILENSKNLVCLECAPHIANQLTENRDNNHLQFHIDRSALSKRKLIQKGWCTIPSDTLLDGYKWVNTITLDELHAKYNIMFDTLILDCEGAFYFILDDMPEILDNITLIIMENDYTDIRHKEQIDKILTKNNFYNDYREAGGWKPCYDCFFEVWKR